MRVARIGKDKETSFKPGDYIEISNDVSDLSDDRNELGIPIKKIGEIRRIIKVDVDTNELSWQSTVSSQDPDPVTGIEHLNAPLL